MDFPHLLVDGRNVMYRAIFANQSNKGARYHHFTVMLRFIQQWVNKFKPISVNIFWDAKKSTVWRRKLYADYKERDKTDYRFDVRDDLIVTQSAAKAMFKVMGVRQFSRKKQEADDLIFSACRILAPHPVVVVSTDQDLHQLPFRMDHVTLYEPMKDNIVEKPDHDPVIAKALAGDKSDVIDGYFKIGPVNGQKMARSMKLRREFLEDKGRGIFLRNMLLMDLSLNPNLLANDVYVSNKFCEDPMFDKALISEAARKYKVKGLMTEYSRSVTPLKLVLERAKENGSAHS